MDEIMEVAKYIRQEMRTADQYAYEALKHREQYPELAQKYYRAAQEHVELADELHDGVSRMVDDAKRHDRKDAPELRSLLEYEHGIMMDDRECVMRKIDMYKG